MDDFQAFQVWWKICDVRLDRLGLVPWKANTWKQTLNTTKFLDVAGPCFFTLTGQTVWVSDYKACFYLLRLKCGCKSHVLVGGVSTKVPWPWHLSWGGGETATPKNETIEEGKRRQNWFMGYQKGHGWVLKAKIFNGASTLEVALRTIAFLWWKLMRKKFRLGVSGHSVFSSASSLLQCHEPQKSNDVDLSCSKNCGDVARSFWYFGTVVCCTRYLISLLDFVTCGVWRTCCFSKRQSHHTVDIRLMHSKPQHCKGSSRNNVSEPRK